MSDPEQHPLEPSQPLQDSEWPSVESRSQAAFPTTAATKAEEFPTWSLWDLLVIIGFGVSAWVILSSIALGVAHLIPSLAHASIQELASNAVLMLGAQSVTEFLVFLFMMAWIGRRTLAGFWNGIQWNWPRAGGVRFVIGGVILALVVEFVGRFLPIPKSLPMEKLFSGMAAAYLMSALGILLAPLLEELFFRGLFYPLARRWAGVAAAVPLTATLFGAIHATQLGFAWAPLLSIFVVGLVFTLVRERTGSVAASFLMHCGYNLALFGSLWVASDGFLHLDKAMN
jgi:membrane protease YdiL (CAAX protease family)